MSDYYLQNYNAFENQHTDAEIDRLMLLKAGICNIGMMN